MRTITSFPSESVEKDVYPRIGHYIGGTWIYDREPSADVLNPSTGNIIGVVPVATDADLEDVLEAASRGFRIWRDTAPEARAAIIHRAIDLMRERAGVIAQILALENGKHLAQARGEVDRSIGFYEWEIGQALRNYGTIVPAGPGFQKLLFRQPIGPVVALTPWNVPMSAIARKSSAALAAGCSVIAKPAQETPGTACAVVKCFEDAGLPAGVFNLVFGPSSRISAALIASPITRMVTFTGSTPVGKKLTEQAGRAMKPVLMELGGNAPVIVCDGVDAGEIGRLSAEAKSRGAGQICASVSRFIVHRNCFDEFVGSFVQELDRLKVGDMFEPGVQMGPLTNARRLSAVEDMVEDARRRGATVAAGGYRIGRRGNFYAPTLLTDIPLDAEAMKEEPFGPVAGCVPFDSVDEALAIANSVDVGLASYVFTNALDEAETISRRLENGVISINHFDTPHADTPFGGVKDTGIGREGGPSSLDAYTVTKTVLQNCSRV